jgi:hypothetical protein
MVSLLSQCEIDDGITQLARKKPEDRAATGAGPPVAAHFGTSYEPETVFRQFQESFQNRLGHSFPVLALLGGDD